MSPLPVAVRTRRRVAVHTASSLSPSTDANLRTRTAVRNALGPLRRRDRGLVEPSEQVRDPAPFVLVGNPVPQVQRLVEDAQRGARVAAVQPGRGDVGEDSGFLVYLAGLPTQGQGLVELGQRGGRIAEVEMGPARTGTGGGFEA